MSKVQDNQQRGFFCVGFLLFSYWKETKSCFNYKWFINFYVEC